MRIQGSPDRLKLEFAFDAQTSGGLLISLPAERAEELVRQLQAGGVPDACVVGRVQPPQDKVAVVIEP